MGLGMFDGALIAISVSACNTDANGVAENHSTPSTAAKVRAVVRSALRAIWPRLCASRSFLAVGFSVFSLILVADQRQTASHGASNPRRAAVAPRSASTH